MGHQDKKNDRKLILWDLDGTLVDSRKDLVQATNVAVTALGYEPIQDDHFARMVGNGVRFLVNRALPKGVSEEDREKAIQIFLDYYRDHIADKTHFFSGIPEILEKLPGIHVVVSNKREDLCRELIRRLGAEGFFQEIVGGDTFDQRKPDPTPILKMLEMFHAEKNETILIGDSIVDMESGRRAGVLTVGVQWGFGDPLENPEFSADKIFEDVTGLGAFLQEWTEAPSGERASARDIRQG
jgi:phosphoglycolate phosphatase